jgi:hypothetical protein
LKISAVKSNNDKMSAGPVQANDSNPDSQVIRRDQVDNAVQFLVHPKVQSSTIEERRKFLLKKGLTDAEIDEAMKLAQPKLEKISSSTELVPSGFSIPTVQPPASNSVVHSAPPVQAPQGPGVWQLLVSAAALVGVGTGLGLLVKRLVSRSPNTFEFLSGQSEESNSITSREFATVVAKLDSMQASVESNSR